MTPRSILPVDDSAATGDRVDLLDAHEERAVDQRGPASGCNGPSPRPAFTIAGTPSSSRSPASAFNALPRMIGVDLAGKAVPRKQLANFQLDEVEQLRVVDQVRLVHEHDQVRHADLTREQDVLASLRHRAVRGGYDQDRTIHLRRAGDHVLHIVGVTRTVDVRVVSSRRLYSTCAVMIVIPRTRSSGVLSI